MMTTKSPYKNAPPLPAKELPKYVLQDFDGDETSFLDEIISQVYWGEVLRLKYRKNGELIERPEGMNAQDWFKVVNDNTDPGEQAQIHTQLIENAHTIAATATSNMAKKSERAFLKVLAIVNQHSMWKSQGEYDNMMDYVCDKFPRLDPSSGEFYEVKFLLETMFPLLEQFAPENSAEVLSNTEIYGKLRGSTSFVREALQEFNEDIQAANRREEEIKDNPDATIKMKEIVCEEASKQREAASEKLSKDIQKVVIALGDKKIPANGPNGIRHILKRDGKQIHFKGRQFIDGKKTVFYLEVPSDYEKAVTNGLPFVEFTMSDMKALQNEINQKIKK